MNWLDFINEVIKNGIRVTQFGFSLWVDQSSLLDHINRTSGQAIHALFSNAFNRRGEGLVQRTNSQMMLNRHLTNHPEFGIRMQTLPIQGRTTSVTSCEVSSSTQPLPMQRRGLAGFSFASTSSHSAPPAEKDDSDSEADQRSGNGP